MDTGALDDVQHAWGLKRAHPLWILPGVGPPVQGSSMHICRFALSLHVLEYGYLGVGTPTWRYPGLSMPWSQCIACHPKFMQLAADCVDGDHAGLRG